MGLADRIETWAQERGGGIGRAAGLASRVRRRMSDDRGTLVAAGLAFYGTLSVVPSALAVVTIYALVTDSTALARQLRRVLEGAPREVESLVVEQVVMIADRAQSNLWVWAVAGFALWAWSASRGTSALLRALNLAYGVEESRGPARRRLIAVVATIVAIAVAVLALGLAQTALNALDVTGGLATVVRWGRWPLFAVLALVALALAYRYGPDRGEVALRWVSHGSAVAAAVWVAATLVLATYLATFGLQSALYGIFGSVLALQLWLFVITYAVLVGAYVNAELSESPATRARDAENGRQR